MAKIWTSRLFYRGCPKQVFDFVTVRICHYSYSALGGLHIHIPQFLDETMKAISTFLNSSPKRSKIFREMMLMLLGHVEKLKKLAPTR